jgi:hypothetical protein
MKNLFSFHFRFALLAGLLVTLFACGSPENAVTVLEEEAATEEAATPVETNYWSDWEKTVRLGSFPGCGVDPRGVTPDDILADTVRLYCGVARGSSYQGYVNPDVYHIYQAKGRDYPDGRTAVLEFPKLGVAFTTDHKDGQPIYDVLLMETEESVASDEPGDPLNPATCAKCHAGYDNACVNRGFLCGNR